MCISVSLSVCMWTWVCVCGPKCVFVSLSIYVWSWLCAYEPKCVYVSLSVCVYTTCWTPSEEALDILELELCFVLFQNTFIFGCVCVLQVPCVYCRCLCVYCRFPGAIALSHLLWVLGSQLQSSAKTASALNCWAISLAPDRSFKVISRLEV